MFGRLSTSVVLCAALVFSALGTRLERVTYTGRDENWSSWAPDGSTILLSSGESVCGGGLWFCGPQNIWSIAYQPGTPTPQGALLRANAYHPRISPDGEWVAGMVHDGDDWDIIVWPTLSLHNGVRFQDSEGYDERFPNWSNDSQFIAFDSNRPSTEGTKGFQIFYAARDAAEGDVTQVSLVGSNNKHPTWSANDDELAYVGDIHDDRSLSAVHLVTGAYRVVTPHASQNRHPDWSPDGKWLAFTTDRWDGIGDVAIVRADGVGEVVRVSVNMPGHDDFPEWSHDSQRILFCGTLYEPPYLPNKEIYVASHLPFDQLVPTQKTSIADLKSLFEDASQ